MSAFRSGQPFCAMCMLRNGQSHCWSARTDAPTPVPGRRSCVRNRGRTEFRGGIMEWRRSNPVYPVADVASSIEWYRRVFGFEPRVMNPPGDVPVYAVLYRDGVSIHLLRKDEAPHGLMSPVEAQF